MHIHSRLAALLLVLLLGSSCPAKEERRVEWIETPATKCKRVWEGDVLVYSQAWPRPEAPEGAPDGTLRDEPGLRFLRWNDQGFEEYLWRKDLAEMVLVPAGHFRMGRPEGEWYERPVHEVELDAYLIDKYEVTVDRYARSLSSHEHRLPPEWDEMQKKDKWPIFNVSWADADEYAFWAGKRLPTEAEWERAAAGAAGNRYPWGDAPPSPERVNYDPQQTRDTADWPRWLGTRSTFLPGASPVGAVNMAGNVAEWCADWYADTTYKLRPYENPRGPSSGHERVLRGGSMFSPVEELLAARRDHAEPSVRRRGIGFRTVVSVADLADAHARSLTGEVGVKVDEGSPSHMVVDRIDPITEVREPVWSDAPDDAVELEGFGYLRTNSRDRHEYLFLRDRFPMVHVPAGTFLMGSSNPRDICERPEHPVSVQGFLMSKYEITVGQYAKFLLNTGHRRPPNWDTQLENRAHPVAWVSWEDAGAYAKWLGMRLPTEAEWEYAARGEEGGPYPWGDAVPNDQLSVCGRPWLDDEEAIGHRVHGRLPAGQSPFGLYDMSGNLWEWTSGWFGCRYTEFPEYDPSGVRYGTRRVVRGGSWREDCGNYHKATTRMSHAPDQRLPHVGIRVVKDLRD